MHTNVQYQWKVLPFQLKVAPSRFQIIMVLIFKPILHNELIYIDDILLFSKNEAAHKKLLAQFINLAYQYGIMLL